VTFLLKPLAIPTQLKLPFISVRPLAIIFLLLVAAYVLGSIVSRKPLKIRDQEFRFPSLKITPRSDSNFYLRLVRGWNRSIRPASLSYIHILSRFFEYIFTGDDGRRCKQRPCWVGRL
jgi:hypothetical protein